MKTLWWKSFTAQIGVTVGTFITDRPHGDSYVRNYRLWLLHQMARGRPCFRMNG